MTNTEQASSLAYAKRYIMVVVLIAMAVMGNYGYTLYKSSLEAKQRERLLIQSCVNTPGGQWVNGECFTPLPDSG